MSNEEEFDLIEWMHSQPQPENVEISVTVKMPGGMVISLTRLESAALWPHRYDRGRIIRGLAEDVADEVERFERGEV